MFVRSCASTALSHAAGQPRTDPTEEVFLLTPDAFAAVDVNELTGALMNVLPHTKVWIVERHAQVVVRAGLTRS
jgi:hypothetical protein